MQGQRIEYEEEDSKDSEFVIGKARVCSHVQ